MKLNHTFRGWNDKFKNASFLPQSKTFIKKAIGFFAFFSILAFFNAVSIEAAIFTVTTNTDKEANGCAVGNCTFREAINAADALAGDDTIDFQIGVAGKIFLSRGDLVISDHIILEGSNFGDLNIIGNDNNRIFFVSRKGVRANTKNLTITGRSVRPILAVSDLIKAQLSPKDASIQIRGRVFELSGKTISQTLLIMTDTSNNTYSSVSNHFGYFHFSSVPAGETCILMAYHNRHTFYPQVIRSFKDMFGVSVIAENNQRISKMR